MDVKLALAKLDSPVQRIKTWGRFERKKRFEYLYKIKETIHNQRGWST